MIECPQHHLSETADYCSVCGTQIDAGQLANGVVGTDATLRCPACNAQRESAQQIFCEVCGYNFRTATPGAPMPTVPAVTPAPAISTAPMTISLADFTASPTPTAPVVKRWDAVVSVDANLYGTFNPDAPSDRPEQVFTLFEKQNILGRATPGVRLQIPIVNDGGVSRRHAVLSREEAGLFVRDLGSANGTQLNGVELLAGVETPVKNGDVLGVGAWTRITFKAVQP